MDLLGQWLFILHLDGLRWPLHSVSQGRALLRLPLHPVLISLNLFWGEQRTARLKLFCFGSTRPSVVGLLLRKKKHQGGDYLRAHPIPAELLFFVFLVLGRPALRPCADLQSCDWRLGAMKDDIVEELICPAKQRKRRESKSTRCAMYKDGECDDQLAPNPRHRSVQQPN